MWSYFRCVYIYIYVKGCTYVGCTYVCTCEKSRGQPSVLSSGRPSMSLESGLFIVLRLDYSAVWPNQQTLGIHLPSSSQQQDHKHVPPQLAFYVGSEDQTLIFTLARQILLNYRPKKLKSKGDVYGVCGGMYDVCVIYTICMWCLCGMYGVYVVWSVCVLSVCVVCMMYMLCL